MAPPRRRRWARPDGRPGARRDGLCGGGRASAHHRALCHVGAADRLCPLRSQPYPRPRTGLLAAGDHRRRRAAAGRRGSGARDRACRDALDHHRSHLRGGGHFQVRLHHGPSLQARALRLCQWHCADRDRRTIAEVVRVLHRCDRLDPRGPRLRRRRAKARPM